VLRTGSTGLPLTSNIPAATRLFLDDPEVIMPPPLIAAADRRR
jgi:hypothetical protein